MSDFAARLNLLFEMVHPPGRKPYTTAEVVAALRISGYTISTSYLSQLRRGKRTNPSDEIVAVLARFFKVKPDYFFNDIYADKIIHDLHLLSQVQSYGLRRLLSRAFDLSEESLNLLASMAEKLQANEEMAGAPPNEREHSPEANDTRPKVPITLPDIDAIPKGKRRIRVQRVSDEPPQAGECTRVAFAVVPDEVLSAEHADRELLPRSVRLRVLLQSDHASVRPMTQVAVLEVDRTSGPILFDVVPYRSGLAVLEFMVYLDRDSQVLQVVRAELLVGQPKGE